MLSKIGNAVGTAGLTVLGFAFFGVILVGPYLIARVFPVQAYAVTEIAGGVAFVSSVIATLAGMLRPARPVAGAVLVISSWILFAFLWVWSVLIVDATWGLVTLYIANFFLAVGAIVVAFVATLLTAQWSTLIQIILIGVIGTGMRVLGELGRSAVSRGYRLT